MNTPFRFAIAWGSSPKLFQVGNAARRVYKPNFVTAQSAATIIHLGQWLPKGSSDLPGNADGRGRRSDGRSELTFPYLVLHREEFTWPSLSPDLPVSFYLTISPITREGWFAFCCTCRHPMKGARMLSGSLPCGVRTFLFLSEATVRHVSLHG
jgi:hypothetical protein